LEQENLDLLIGLRRLDEQRPITHWPCVRAAGHRIDPVHRPADSLSEFAAVSDKGPALDALEQRLSAAVAEPLARGEELVNGDPALAAAVADAQRHSPRPRGAAARSPGSRSCPRA